MEARQGSLGVLSQCSGDRSGSSRPISDKHKNRLERAQLTSESLLRKLEDLSFNPQQPHEKSDGYMHTCNLSAMGKDRKVVGACWLLATSRLNPTLSQGNKRRSDRPDA